MAPVLRTCAPFCFALLLTGCDNVGRAFDPHVDPHTGPPGPAAPSTIEVPPDGGDLRDGRPTVKAVYPKAGGWPTSVPIVVEFSESVNTASIAPTTTGGNDGKIFVRVKNTTQVLPAQYDFLGGNRLLVMRPSPGLSNQGNPSYEVVLKPGARDADGITFSGSADQVLAEFTVDAPATENDGKILALFPRDNTRDVPRESTYIAVFTRGATESTLTPTTANFHINVTGGGIVAGSTALPLSQLTVHDGRVVEFTPNAPGFAASTQHELVVTAGITFGSSGTPGTLSFNNRTPFAHFTTTGVPAPTSIQVGNASAGFPNMINRGNLANLQIDVAVPADALANDRIVARLYGGDRSTTATNDIVFSERAALVPANGAQTVRIDFSGQAGTLERPKFDEGSVVLLAQLQRGTAHSVIVRGSSNSRLVTTQPTIVRFGPPGAATGTDVFTDQESLVLYGTASEQLAEASLTDGTTSVSLYSSTSDGHFVMQPFPLGRRTSPLGYQLLITDVAGNLAAAPVTGNIVQRGLYTGTVTGALTVVAYDDTTLLPVANATVLVDPGTPVVPAAGQVTATTAADGSAAFTGLAGATNTITVVAAGYNLTTLYNTAAAFASLPLHPRAPSTATLRGTVSVVVGGIPSVTLPTNNTAMIGCSVYDYPTVLSVTSSSAAPTVVPPTPILANRPQVLTALVGVFEPTATPTFTFASCNLLGTTLVTPSPPAAPVAPGTEATRTFVLLPQTGLVASLATLVSEDWSLATGLDTTNLTPTVRFTLSLSGFPEQVLFGVGFANPGSGLVFNSNGSWAQAIVGGLTPFLSGQWVVTEARDSHDRMSRHRAQLNVLTNSPTDRMDPMAIPAVTGPASVTGSPAVDVNDVLDASTLPGLAMLEVVAKDADGRQWTVLAEDTNPATGVSPPTHIQFPDLATAAVTGLRASDWTVRASARTFFPVTSSSGSVVLAEPRRMEFGYARSATITVTVQ
jgi:hypothetical protein